MTVVALEGRRNMRILQSGSGFLGGGGAPAAPVPAAGGELLTNGGFEGAYDTEAAGIDIAPSWDKWLLAAPDTAAKETTIVRSGAAAQAFTTATSLRGIVDVGFNVTSQVWYIGRVWVRVAAGTQGVRLTNYSTRWVTPNVLTTVGTTYQEIIVTTYSVGTGSEALLLRNGAAAANTFYVDDASLKPLTLASLISTRPYASPDCDLSASVTRTAGTQAGFAVRVDNPSSPANFIIGYLDGAGNLKTDKCLAGTYTNIAGLSGAVTYVAGQRPRIVCSGNNVSVYYNGIQIGSTTAVADAGIVSNVNHGLFSTYAANTFTGFTAA